MKKAHAVCLYVVYVEHALDKWEAEKGGLSNLQTYQRHDAGRCLVYGMLYPYVAIDPQTCSGVGSGETNRQDRQEKTAKDDNMTCILNLIVGRPPPGQTPPAALPRGFA